MLVPLLLKVGELGIGVAKLVLPFWQPSAVVLIVEDHATTAELMMRGAAETRTKVIIARDASEALGILTRNGQRFKLIVIDVHLPGRSGWSLREELMARWPTLLVCMMSAAPEALIKLPIGDPTLVLYKDSNYYRFFRVVAAQFL